jgi:glycosidase
MQHLRQLALTLLLLAVAGCTDFSTPPQPLPTPSVTVKVEASPPTTPTPSLPTSTTTGFPWWNDTVFYEIFVRSFYDSDSDGIGDLNGLIEKLDYLNDGDPTTTDDLGITGIWLMPISESPSYHGYDVVDYFAVEQDYGTNEDFRRLIDAAHQRGIRVIIDLVLNHTSSRHPWFVSARNDPDSPYRDFYIWSDTHPGFKSPWGGPAWHRAGTGFYYGLFWEGMPDLNYDNPAVTREMRKAIRFWLEDMGADGFRLDAIKHLIEEGRVQENTPATHTWLRGFYSYYKAVNPDAMSVGEVWSPTTEVVKYIGDQLDLAFEFDTAEAMIRSARLEDRHHILRAHRLIAERYPPNQFATFLTNHDQERVLSELRENVEKAKVAASLLLTGPGVPFIYYGEEIGQVGGKPDENIRTPMQWTTEENAGFTTASIAWRAPQRNYRQVNVAAQTADSNSLLSHYRRLMRVRNTHPALRIGDWREVQVEDKRVYAYLRHTDGETMLVLINLSGEPIDHYSLRLDKGPLSTGSAREILVGAPVRRPVINPNGGFDAYTPLAVLKPYETYVIRLK